MAESTSSPARPNSKKPFNRKVYHGLLADLARELTEEETRQLAFRHEIKDNQYKDALHLFSILREREVIGTAEKLEELAEHLESMNRKDLATKTRESIQRMEVRTTQSLTLPEPERGDLGKRSYTVPSGIPLSIQYPLQETTEDILTPSSSSTNKLILTENSSQPEDTQFMFSTETSFEAEQSQHHDDRSEASPYSETRSRKPSDPMGPGGHSRSRSRSPSMHLATSVSGHHTPSDQSTYSLHQDIPQTESERQYVLMSKFLDLLKSKSNVSSSELNSLASNIIKPTENFSMESKSQASSLKADPSQVNSVSVTSDGTHKYPADQSQGPSKQKSSRSMVSKLLSWTGKSRSTSSADALDWIVKRDQFNKIIYRHQDHTIECKNKIEVGVWSGSNMNPQLSLILHPYGIEEDSGNHVTLEVRIKVPKKAPKLKEATSVKLTLTISKIYSENSQFTMTENLHLRVFYRKKFISHKVLRESESDVVEIEAQAECLHPTTVAVSDDTLGSKD